MTDKTRLLLQIKNDKKKSKEQDLYSINRLNKKYQNISDNKPIIDKTNKKEWNNYKEVCCCWSRKEHGLDYFFYTFDLPTVDQKNINVNQG